MHNQPGRKRQIKGYIDRSELYKIKGNSLESFVIGKHLNINNETEILTQLDRKRLGFSWFEDPDIYIDEENRLDACIFYCSIKLVIKQRK